MTWLLTMVACSTLSAAKVLPATAFKLAALPETLSTSSFANALGVGSAWQGLPREALHGSAPNLSEKTNVLPEVC